MRVLLLGDENVSFIESLLEHESFMACDIELCLCLKEDLIKDEIKKNIQMIKKKNINIHYNIVPSQLKNHFPPDTYDTILFILPGLAFHGCPDFINPSTDLFQLRLHLFTFGFLKSAKPILKTNGTIWILWPDKALAQSLSNRNNQPIIIPFADIDLENLARFCIVTRTPDHDSILDPQLFSKWKPVLHNVARTLDSDPWMSALKFYTFCVDEMDKQEKRKSDCGEVPINVLRVPPSIFSYSMADIPNINDLFEYKLYARNSKQTLICKLKCKYDPREKGWKGDGNVHQKMRNRFDKRGRGGSYGGRGNRGMGHMGGGGGGNVLDPSVPPPPHGGMNLGGGGSMGSSHPPPLHAPQLAYPPRNSMGPPHAAYVQNSTSNPDEIYYIQNMQNKRLQENAYGAMPAGKRGRYDGHVQSNPSYGQRSWAGGYGDADGYPSGVYTPGNGYASGETSVAFVPHSEAAASPYPDHPSYASGGYDAPPESSSYAYASSTAPYPYSYEAFYPPNSSQNASVLAHNHASASQPPPSAYAYEPGSNGPPSAGSPSDAPGPSRIGNRYQYGKF